MRKILAITAAIFTVAWLASLPGCASHTELGGQKMGVTANWTPPPGQQIP